MKIKTATTKYAAIPLCSGSLFNTANMNISVDWGDGTTQTITSPLDQSIELIKDTENGQVICNLIKHSYKQESEYTIEITGGFGSSSSAKIAFAQRCKKNNGVAEDINADFSKASLSKITEISELSGFYIHGQGDFKDFSSLQSIGSGASSLLSADPTSKIQISTSNSAKICMDKTFEGCSSLTSISFVPGQNSNNNQPIQSMQYTFKSSSYNENIANLNWDTSTCQSFKGMFESSTNFDQNINSWYMVNATDVSDMFKNTSYNKPLDKWFKKTNGVSYSIENTSGMFEGNSSFAQSLNDWDVSTIENCSNMFKNTTYNRPMWKWKTNSMKNLSGMFEGNSSFDQNLNNWNASTFEDTSNMFKDTSYNKPLDKWFKKTDGVSYSIENTSGMFENNPSFNKGLNDWDTRTITDTSNMFKNTSYSQSLEDWFKTDPNISYSIKNISGMFEDNPVFNKAVGDWDVSSVENASNMFKNASQFNQSCRKWQTTSMKYVNGMFENSSFNKNINDWNTSTIEDASNMFKDTSYNQPMWKWFKKQNGVSFKIKNVSGMFEGNTAFKQNIGNWDSSTFEDTSNMFKNTAYNKPMWKWFKPGPNNTYSIKNVSGMFEGNTAFKQNINSWDTRTIEDSSRLFKDTAYNKPMWKWFSDIAGTKAGWSDTNYVIRNVSGMFEGNTAFEQNVNEWNSSTLEDTSNMFKNAAYNKPMWKWFKPGPNNTYSIKNVSGMFEGNTEFNQNINSWDTRTVEDISHMFKDSHFNRPLWKWFQKKDDTNYSLKKMNGVFQGSKFSQNVTGSDSNPNSGWDTSTVEEMENAFSNLDVATYPHSLDRILERATNVQKFKGFKDGSNLGKPIPDTLVDPPISGEVSLQGNELTITASLLGYNYWGYKVVNNQTQTEASVNETIVDDGSLSRTLILTDDAVYSIYLFGH
jgi:hypothetical protein